VPQIPPSSFLPTIIPRRLGRFFEGGLRRIYISVGKRDQSLIAGPIRVSSSRFTNPSVEVSSRIRILIRLEQCIQKQMAQYFTTAALSNPGSQLAKLFEGSVGPRALSISYI